MAKSVKCPYCESYLDKDEAISYKKRYYHEECFNTWRLEADHRKELIDYILEIYNLEAPTGMMLKQIKDFQEDYNYKLKGIELALRYFHETLDNRPQENGGIGIVPFIYEEAKRHYIKQQKIAESIHDFKQQEEITVCINTKADKRKSKKIDITAI